MIPNNDLRDRFRALAAASPKEAGPQVQEQLLIQFRKQHQSSRRWTYAVVGLAASVLLLLGLYFLAPGRRHVGPEITSVQAVEMSGFIALPYAQSDVPLEQPVILHTTIPASELNRIGVIPVHRGTKERVAADLLIGEDGVPRAIRLVE
jgi:hypothetical protein